MQREEEPIYIGRCGSFLDRIGLDRFGDSMELKAVCAVTKEPVPYEKRLKLKYKELHTGDRWGGKWESAWVHVTCDIPEEWRKEKLALHLNFTGEALIFDEKGCPLYAVTGGSNFDHNYRKDQYVLPQKTVRSGKVDFWIELAGNTLFGMNQDMEADLRDPDHDGTFTGVVNAMELCCFREDVWQLVMDYCILWGIFSDLPAEDYRRRRLLYTMSEIAEVYAYDPANAGAARKIAKKELSIPAYASAMTAYTVGHAHIDTAWLWPVRETIRKCARTFASQIDLIGKYPGYIFGASSPQHYLFVKEHYPELYAKIKKAVAAGSWELQGGMWVEPDCNLISGESMVRQFLHGKNFFMDEFGKEVKNLWIPDVFGYSAALPQIMRKAGCDYFLTQKMSWNRTNRFPYHSFFWRGLDGSEVLTHFPPADTYNWSGKAQAMTSAQNRYHESVQTGLFLNLMGIGDGGCGPSEAHVEKAKRLENLEGMPRVKFGRADTFFAELEKYKEKLPLWNGELYLEKHQGTLTTQAKTKLGNRKCEQMLTAVEFLYSALPLKHYPAKELDRLWKLLLLNQFHDILPGSGIGMIYEDTAHDHKEILSSCEALVKKAAALQKRAKNAITLFNTLSYDYTRLVELPAEWAGFRVTSGGKELAVQLIQGRPYARITVKKGSSAILKKGGALAPKSKKSKTKVLENTFVRYTFNEAGAIVEAYDKECDRQLLKTGEAGNVLKLYHDRPSAHEAWDIEPYYRDSPAQTPFAVKFSSVETGALGSSLVIEGKIGESSSFVQEIFLASDSKRLDFRTKVEWHEVRKMLRVSFPVNVFCSEAAFDIQYGYLKRPIYANTSWDAARFEVVGQRYMDLSERDYGVALLNNCKYGHRCDNTGLDLCLLRSPKFPDWTADQGTQEFTYSLLPHCGDLTHSCVMAESAMLNRAPLALECAEELAAPVILTGDHVTLEVVKKAEKSGDLICRMTETAGAPCKAELAVKSTSAEEVDLMEWKTLRKETVKAGKIQLSFTPFEIKTLRIKGIRA